jgi:predicted O-methyltransferase YrrM
MLLSGSTMLASGEHTKITGYIDRRCGVLLQRVIRELRPSVSVEVGLAFGISTLYMLEALAETGGRLIGMDPAQHDNHWQGGGLFNITRAGYDSLYEFHEATSQQILPRLAGEGLKIDFAFIDGWHTFDHTLVDFFYIDQILNEGGIVVFDDVGYPSVKRACDFIIANRDFEVYDCVRQPDGHNIRKRVKHRLRRILNPLVRTDKTPSLEVEAKEYSIHDVYFLALKKLSDDGRRWDHFVHF